jgi:hypothetical protein
MLWLKPSPGLGVPSLLTLAGQALAPTIVRAVLQHPSPDEIWRDQRWKAFRQTLHVS